MNHTFRAVDLIPKDVVICDWHYERADPTAPYFALKGFTVLTCPWNRPEVAEAQLESTLFHRRHATPEMRPRFAGMLHTVWSDAGDFLDQFFGRAEPDRERGDPIACTRWYLTAMRDLGGTED